MRHFKKKLNTIFFNWMSLLKRQFKTRSVGLVELDWHYDTNSSFLTIMIMIRSTHKKAVLFFSKFLFHLFHFISSFLFYFFFTVFFLYPKMLELLFFGQRTQLKWCSEKNGLTQIVFLWKMSYLHRQCLRVTVSHTRAQRLCWPWDVSS